MSKHGKDGKEKPARVMGEKSELAYALAFDRYDGDEEGVGEDRSWHEEGERPKPPKPRIVRHHSSD